MQWLLGTSVVTYTRWAEKRDCQPIIDDIGNGARLLWVGERRYDRSKVGRGESQVGVAFLDYGLAPYVNFPTPLLQANAALSHLFSHGVTPQHLQIVADSAGANIILQVLSHALHPMVVNTIPRSPLAPMLDSADGMPRLKGIYMLAPYIYFDTARRSACYEENGACDVASAVQYRYCGAIIPSVPRNQYPFIEPAVAPQDWFEDAGRVVERMLVTTGQYEVSRDHIVDFCRDHLRNIEELTCVLVEGGVHGDPILTFDQAEGKKVTDKIVSWLKDGFE
ncbi:hypothetical protein HWV62_12054 [Athelia sp. TMB]|nr:hypothetical protein HWV62_12054 [Athelia sp. TMB]